MVVCQSEQGFNSKICPQNMFINHSYIKYDVFLGSVISALAEASAKQAANQKAHFIPYRLAYKNLFFMPQISRDGGVTELWYLLEPKVL